MPRRNHASRTARGPPGTMPRPPRTCPTGPVRGPRRRSGRARRQRRAQCLDVSSSFLGLVTGFAVFEGGALIVEDAAGFELGCALGAPDTAALGADEGSAETASAAVTAGAADADALAETTADAAGEPGSGGGP